MTLKVTRTESTLLRLALQGSGIYMPQLTEDLGDRYIDSHRVGFLDGRTQANAVRSIIKKGFGVPYPKLGDWAFKLTNLGFDIAISEDGTSVFMCLAHDCKCDANVTEKHRLKNADAVDFNSSAASKDGGFLERLG